MKLSETTYDNSETGCCARLDESRWDGQTFTWNNKPFLKDHIREFLHIPLNYGSVITRDHAAIEAAEAYPAEPLWLTEEVSPWGAEVFVATDGDVPNASMEHLSGTFMTKVFDGPYRNAGKWERLMGEHVRAQGHDIKHLYSFYATCPRCAKHFGKNQVVLFAQVA